MTAALTTPRPALYLVPGARRRAGPPAPDTPPVVAGPLGALAAEVTARVLGTRFAPVAGGLAQALAARAPLLARRARPELWAAAIAFLLAEQARLFDYDHCGTRTSLARELGSTLPTLRRRAADLRLALHPLDLDLPDPVADEEGDDRKTGSPALVICAGDHRTARATAGDEGLDVRRRAAVRGVRVRRCDRRRA